jgi:hypothetical protein
MFLCVVWDGVSGWIFAIALWRPPRRQYALQAEDSLRQNSSHASPARAGENVHVGVRGSFRVHLAPCIKAQW